LLIELKGVIATIEALSIRLKEYKILVIYVVSWRIKMKSKSIGQVLDVDFRASIIVRYHKSSDA